MILENMPQSPVVASNSVGLALTIDTIKVHIGKGNKKSFFVTPALVEKRLSKCTAEELNCIKNWLKDWLENLNERMHKIEIQENFLGYVVKGVAAGAAYGYGTVVLWEHLVGSLSKLSFWGCVATGSCVEGSLRVADENQKVIDRSNVIEAKNRIETTIALINGLLSTLEKEDAPNIRDNDSDYIANFVMSTGIKLELEAAQHAESKVWRRHPSSN